MQQLLSRREKKNEEPIYFAKDLQAMYTVFRDQIHNPASVLYPSCGFDASPTRVFNNVTFVDKEEGNEGCVAKLQEAGFHALKMDIREYVPTEEHDLLILLNPAMPADWATPHLRTDGYSIANNYHLTASQLNARPDRFSLVGIIDYDAAANTAKLTLNSDGTLRRTVSIDSIEESRPMEHLAFVMDARREQRAGLPFERVADRYIFQKK